MSFFYFVFQCQEHFAKIDYLRVLCNIYKPDCIRIVESWLSGDVLDGELCIDGYNIIHLDRNRHGGGVLLFIYSVFTHHVVITGNHKLELVIVSVRLSLTIAHFYHAPGSNCIIMDNLLIALCTHMNPPL